MKGSNGFHGPILHPLEPFIRWRTVLAGKGNEVHSPNPKFEKARATWERNRVNLPAAYRSTSAARADNTRREGT